MNNNGHNALLTDAERAERLRRLNELYQQQEMHQQQQQQQQQLNPQYNTLHQGNTGQSYHGNSHNNNYNRCYEEKTHDHVGPINDDEDEDDECIDKAEEAFLDKMEQHMNTLQSHHTSAPHSISGIANTNSNPSHAATGSSSAQTTFYRIDESEMNIGTVIATEVNVQRRTIGDFELLRLAKVGDKESFYQFASMTHTSIASFEDNQKRNALHYAADSGNLTLIRALQEDKRVFDALNVSDAKGLFPIDIALLNGYTNSELLEILQPSETVVASAASAEKTALHTKGSNINDNNGIDYAPKVNALLAKFAPTPPRFVLSKPIPPAPSASNQTTLFMRSFWRQYKTMEERVNAARTTLSEAQSARHIHVMEYTNPTHTIIPKDEEEEGDYKHELELQELLRKFCTHMQHASREHSTGLLRTLHDQCLLHTLPAIASNNNNENNEVNDKEHMISKGCRVFCALQQKSTSTTDKNHDTNVIGVLVVKMAQGTFHYGKEQRGKANASVEQSSAFVRVVYLGVLPEYRKSGVASLLLHYVYLHLSDNINYDNTASEVAKPTISAATVEGNNLVQDGVVFFTTSSQLVQPPTTIGAVKWFARILQPSKLFKMGENSYHYVHSGSLINNTTLPTDATETIKAEVDVTTESTNDDSNNASKIESTISTSNGSCMTITGNDLIANLFHSFVEYDTVLRADIILKNALADSFVSKLAQLCTQWMLIDDTHIDHVASFLAATCQSTTQSSSSSSSSSSLFETTLCFVPTSAQELRAMLQHNNNNKDLRVYARFAHGAHVDKIHEESNVDKNQITDLVIVQVHTFKDAKAMMNENAHSTSNVLFNLENDSANVSTEQNTTNNNNEANTGTNKLNSVENESLSDLHVAQVVFSMFTTFKGIDKVEVMLSLANQYIHADALFVPTVCGTTDSDLVKVNFEEFLDCREFLYAVNRKEPCNSCALPTPVSQLCLPLCLC